MSERRECFCGRRTVFEFGLTDDDGNAHTWRSCGKDEDGQGLDVNTLMSERMEQVERAEKAEADALVLIANNETLQREAKDAWRRVDEYARIVQRVVGLCENKYVGPSTTYGEGFQNGYNDALYRVLRALK